MNTPSPVICTFDRDTELAPGLDGALEGSISDRWDARGGPHGGYLAALMLRGMTIALDDPARAPLTLTIQFVRQPAFGPVALHASVERTGRSLTSMSARLAQGGAIVALAVCAFATRISGLEYDERPMPSVEGPWDDRHSMTSDQAPPFVHNFVLQPRFEWPFRGEATPMVAGGWTGLPRRRPLDAPAIALFSDAWFPPPYTRLANPAPSPTISLSVYFRARLPRPEAEDDDLCLARFETRLVRDGCFQSEGAIWAQDGRVLAESHQLQLLLAE
jgi:acyl-CoA thioesterase